MKAEFYRRAIWLAAAVGVLAAGPTATAFAAAAPQVDAQALLRRIDQLEQRIQELQQARDAAGAPAATAAATPGPTIDTQALLDRLDALDQRLGNLESSAVLSEPETRVKRIEVYVDKNGNEYDEPAPGAEKRVTYQRERVFRRQTINEKIEEALAGESEKSVQLGINAAMVTQGAARTESGATDADGHVYALASADLLFNAHLAQYTNFFADVVGLSGSPPDSEIQGLTLLNSYTARLVRQNEINLREAWLRTELFDQKLAVSLGRLDLTSMFDRNTAANDETSQFLSDALVNNPVLGLSSNGAGLAAVYDPKKSWNFKFGVQQSNPDATNLSDSVYTLAEVGYRARPAFLGEGNYRAWYRTDNSAGRQRTGYGVSLDQKLTAHVTAFGRYGSAEPSLLNRGRDRFASVGLQLQTAWVLNPQDVWGIGYSQLDLATHQNEKLFEAYYNMHLSEKLHISFHLQNVAELEADGTKRGFVVPGLRFQAGL
jgi:hypothetical protein